MCVCVSECARVRASADVRMCEQERGERNFQHVHKKRLFPVLKHAHVFIDLKPFEKKSPRVLRNDRNGLIQQCQVKPFIPFHYHLGLKFMMRAGGRNVQSHYFCCCISQGRSGLPCEFDADLW